MTYYLLLLMPTTITEGTTTLLVHTGKVSKKLPVFYNPIMKLNRDLGILLVQQYPQMEVLDLLSASGARAVRLAKETKCKSITANDWEKKAVALIKKNAKTNKVTITVENKDANVLLAQSKGWDYIDIDPYGSPNPYLDQAVQHLRRKGILAITATDTAPLSGTYPNACKRKYWATPLRNHLMHEVGMRILIRKAQLIAAQHDKALRPLFVHNSEHYMRAYLQQVGGKKETDKVLKDHRTICYCHTCDVLQLDPKKVSTCLNQHKHTLVGPLYVGELWDHNLVKKMLKKSEEGEAQKLLKIISEEMKIETIFFHDIHRLCKKNKLSVPKHKKIFEAIKKKKETVSLTHFNQYGIKTTMKEKELCSILKKLQ